VLQCVALAIMFLFYFKWMWYLWKKPKENKATSLDEWKCNNIVIMGLGTWLALMICSYCISNPKPYRDYTEFDLCHSEICFTSFTVMQFLYQTRISQKTVSKYKVWLMSKHFSVIDTLMLASLQFPRRSWSSSVCSSDTSLMRYAHP
jgi:hypothetical protein